MNETIVVDVNGLDVATDELLYHGIQNTFFNKVPEPKYLYQRGTKFVNEYGRRDDDGNLFDGTNDNPNHLMGAFPYLFPYGVGGFETKRKRNISYSEHSVWALRYHDGRFANNMSFMGQIFNVLQKRRVCRAAELQVSLWWLIVYLYTY